MAMKTHQRYKSFPTTLQCQNMKVPITEYSELKLISQYSQETGNEEVTETLALTQQQI